MLVARIGTDFKSVMVRGYSLFSESRHKTLTKQLRACYDSGAFSETTEGALFLPGAKDEKAPLFEGVFLFQRHPHREGTGSGCLEGRGVVSG